VEPYRDGYVERTCPRCRHALTGDPDDRMSDPCGEWLVRARLEPVWELIVRADLDPLAVFGVPHAPGAFPVCKAEMVVAVCRRTTLGVRRSRIAFDWCTEHGVWLDAGEGDVFVAAFGLERDP
jgi:hypothetical protein